jgi:uncharacterized integral membrane protein
VTIKRFFSWAIGIPVAVVFIAFAVANRQWITVSFDPLSRENPWLAISMPAFMLFFAGIFLGLIVGGIVVWARQAKWRRAARRTDVAPQQAQPKPPVASGSTVPRIDTQ